MLYIKFIEKKLPTGHNKYTHIYKYYLLVYILF